MATQIIRYSNRAEYMIKNLQVDLDSEEVNVADYAQVDDNHIYFIGGSDKELVAKEIGSERYKRAFIDHNEYCIDERSFEELIKTGQCTATYYNRSVNVYAGLHAMKVLNEMGEKSLAKCYAYIAERRKEHAKALSDAERLRATAKKSASDANTFDNLVEDIKWFLDNRMEIKAKCK